MKNIVLHQFILDGLINQIPYAIFWKDINFVFRGCNQQFARQFGHREPKEIIGKTDYDFPFLPHLREKYRNDDAEVLKGVAKLNYEEEQTQMDGTIKTVLVSKIPLYDNNKEIIGILGVYADITERKRQEKELIEAKNRAESANKAKTEFLENMRHDLRTPLSGITGFANILKKEAKGTKFEEYAHHIAESGELLLFLLNEILETIRVTSGDVPLLKVKFNLKMILENIVKLNQPRAKEKSLELAFDYDDSIPRYSMGDPKRIQRIALELVTNALNYTNQGSVTLSAQLAKQKNKDFIVKLTVTDTGIGIPYDKQQEIFTRFRKLTPSYQCPYKGAGLGLTIVKHYMDDLDGEIYVENEIPNGTKFTCIIPLKTSLLEDDFGTTVIDKDDSLNYVLKMPAKYKTTREKNQNKDSVTQSSRVLLVEDNLIATRITTMHLNELTCIVDHAQDGISAITMSKENHYDIILMDIGLPDMTGIEVTRSIRQNELGSEMPVPIIALTAHVDDERNQQCMQSGMSAVFCKPIEKAIIEDILNAFVPGRFASES